MGIHFDARPYSIGGESTNLDVRKVGFTELFILALLCELEKSLHISTCLPRYNIKVMMPVMHA